MIFQERERGLKFLTLKISLVVSIVAYLLAYYLRLGVGEGSGWSKIIHSRAYQMAVVLTWLGLIIDHLRMKDAPVRSLHYLPDWPRSLIVSLIQVVSVMIMMAIYVLASKDFELSREFIFLFLLLLFCGLALVQRYSAAWLGSLNFCGSQLCRCLLLAPDWVGLQKARDALANSAHLGLEGTTEKFFDADVLEHESSQQVWLQDFAATLRQGKHDAVLFAQCPLEIDFLTRLKNCTDSAGVRLIAQLDTPTEFTDCLVAEPSVGLQFINVRHEPLQRPFNRLLKRTCDLAIALPVVVLVLPPLALLVALGQRLQSRGPLLYSQIRGGLSGRKFVCYKFRTMKTDHGCESRQAEKLDPRVFPFGRWLRRTSLDEMPQFWNVLKGEMTLVGPRPHLLEHDEDFTRMAAQYPLRQLIKPGLTGLAQIRGFRGRVENVTDMTKRVAADILYIHNWSFFLDIKIILLTAKQVFFAPPSAH